MPDQYWYSLSCIDNHGWLNITVIAKLKTPYMVLAILVPVLFIPMFLTPTGTQGIYNQLLFLLPYHAMMPEFGKYISYQIGSLVFDVLSVRMIVYPIIAIVFVISACHAFKKHQVSA